MNKDREPQAGSLTVEKVAEIAKETLLRDGYHVPTVLVSGSQQDVAIQITELADTSDERQRQMFHAGFILAQEHVVGVPQQIFFISEGWMSVGTQDSLPMTPPSQDPNRKEVLLIAHTNILTVEDNVLTFEMLRDREGKLIGLTQLHENTEGRQAESPLIRAFVTGFAMGLGGPVQ
jgi:hypothetical protein